MKSWHEVLGILASGSRDWSYFQHYIKEEERVIDDDGLNESELEVDRPDTSSFTAFLYSFLSSTSNSGDNNGNDVSVVGDDEMNENLVVKKGLLSKGKQSLGRNNFESDDCGVEMKTIQKLKEVPSVDLVDRLPEISEPSMLISNSLRNAVYDSLPSLIHGRKWLMLYSTWKHGISLSTLYRRRLLWPGPSLLVVGDRKGAVFGSLVEAPFRPSTKRKYQGTNSTFVFTTSLVILSYIVQQHFTDEGKALVKLAEDATSLVLSRFHPGDCAGSQVCLTASLDKVDCWLYIKQTW